jgi:hypothetical protein
LASLLFAQLRTFGPQTLQLVGHEFLPQERIQQFAVARVDRVARRLFDSEYMVGEAGETRGVRKLVCKRRQQSDLIRESPGRTVFCDQGQALAIGRKGLVNFA